MNKTTLRLTFGMVIGMLAVLSVQAGSLEPPPGPVSPTRPPDTCFDNTGNRFVDCDDGTVKDTETGLFWLKDAGCFQGPWANVSIRAAELAHGQCGLTDGSLPGDWRLPTLECPSGGTCAADVAVGEFASIFAPTCPAPFVLNTAGTGCWSEGDPFIGVVSYFYWSSMPRASIPLFAWVANLSSGSADANHKGTQAQLWPVRGGQQEGAVVAP